MKMQRHLQTTSAVSFQLLLWRLLVVGVLITCGGSTAFAQSVTKVFDMNFSVGGGTGYGPNFPKGRLVPVGTNYWFLDENGGTFGFGGIYSFDPATTNVTQLAGFDNNSGHTPWASMTYADGKMWFTTGSGGGGNRGTLSYIDTNTLTVAAVYSFPTNNNVAQLDCGEGPRSTPVLIGSELWMLTGSGGTNGTARGAICRYNLTNGIMSPVFHFDGTNYGRQPYGSLVKQGNAHYFTTFAGGTNVNPSGFPNGAGTLGRVTFDGLGNPVVTKLVNLPTGHTAFPNGDVCPVGTNHLYFTTSGNTSLPGSLIRYDIANNTWTNLFTFTAAAKTNYGSVPGASTPIHVDGNLYFTTQTGGTSNKGVVLKYNIANHAMTKLADLSGGGAASLGGGPQYHSATYVDDPDNCKKLIYMLIARGGAFGPVATGYGTLISINLSVPVLAITNATPGNLLLSWRGGYPPFTVQSSTNLDSANWTTLVSGLTTNQTTIYATNSARFFRVSSPCQ